MTDSPFFVNDWGQGLNNWLQLGERISERIIILISRHLLKTVEFSGTTDQIDTFPEG